MSEIPSPECPTPTSTAGKSRRKKVTAPSGALSSRQIIALVQQGKWWPFERVDGNLLVKMHRATEKQTTEDLPEALL